MGKSILIGVSSCNSLMQYSYYLYVYVCPKIEWHTPTHTCDGDSLPTKFLTFERESVCVCMCETPAVGYSVIISSFWNQLNHKKYIVFKKIWGKLWKIHKDFRCTMQDFLSVHVMLILFNAFPLHLPYDTTIQHLCAIVCNCFEWRPE